MARGNRTIRVDEWGIVITDYNNTKTSKETENEFNNGNNNDDEPEKGMIG